MPVELLTVTEETAPVLSATQNLGKALTAGLTTIQADALAVIASIVPIALVIVGASLVIKLGIKAFKKISNG